MKQIKTKEQFKARMSQLKMLLGQFPNRRVRRAVRKITRVLAAKVVVK